MRQPHFNGSELWEIVFGILKGDIPDSLTDEVFTRIADAVRLVFLDSTFQSRVHPWMLECFGEEIAADRLERDDRLLEEVLELLQSADYPRERITALTSYVYGRDKGEPFQETGGVMVTLAARCLAYGIDMHEAGEAELARVWTKVEKIRAKQAAKPVGSALPMAFPSAPTSEVTDAMVERACRSRYSAFDDWSDELKAEERYRIRAALNAALVGA